VKYNGVSPSNAVPSSVATRPSWFVPAPSVISTQATSEHDCLAYHHRTRVTACNLQLAFLKKRRVGRGCGRRISHCAFLVFYCTVLCASLVFMTYRAPRQMHHCLSSSQLGCKWRVGLGRRQRHPTEMRHNSGITAASTLSCKAWSTTGLD